MLYEVYLTVEPKPGLIPPIGQGKIVDLNLDTPSPNRQVMVGETRDIATLAEASNWALRKQIELQQEGWMVKRRKLETRMGPGKVIYREAHWKLPIVGAKAAVDLERFRSQWKFLLSYSNLQEVVYLSIRKYFGPFEMQEKAFKFYDERVQEYMPGVKFHFENVLEDSNEGLDAGWVG